MSKKSLLCRITLLSFIKILSYKNLWRSSIRCIASILHNFFALQYKAALFPKKQILSHVDHPLDKNIPFDTSWVTIYMDFSSFWIRTQGFLLEKFGKSAVPFVRDFIDTIAQIYCFAASVYRENFSTTARPRYYGKLKFIAIHIFDPHLMCVPSLHVMVAVCTFVKFCQAVAKLDDKNDYADEIIQTRERSLAITESILYVKQHSVNCIPAALYSLTRYNNTQFEPDIMNDFIKDLFKDPQGITLGEDIKLHIKNMYQQFLDEGASSNDWRYPLLRFLENTR
ncbi:MAG: hypothetical protein LBD07_06145 [Spirochaetaceae bacterium]|jgi:hypothetical protein|nr:hypothetical protein [Spirochaetaceae bacterium]